MQSGAFATESSTKLLERLAYQVNHALHTGDADSVHDLRVAVRRFNQSIVLFKQVFPPKESKKIRRRLKNVMNLTGDIRDCDIAIKMLEESELPGADGFQEPLSRRRKQAIQQLQPALRRWGARKTSSKWRAALTPDGAGNLPLEDTAGRRLARLTKRFLKHAAKASSGKELHEVRIEAKKLRYSLELLEPTYGEPAAQWLEHTKNVQSLLGKINDCRAVRVLVADLGGDAGIEAWLKKRQRKRTREFQDQWPAAEEGLRGALAPMRESQAKPAVTNIAGPA